MFYVVNSHACINLFIFFQTALIEQNLTAQENICKALVESYAQFSKSRRYIQDIINKRSSTINALVTSYDTYEDLLAKANKGLEFYNKLETNVSKLLGRIKSACKVQQEERDQIITKNAKKTESAGKLGADSIKPEPTKSDDVPATRAPKLKDYLDSMKAGVENWPGSPGYGQIESNAWPPSIRLPPLGNKNL